MKLHLFRVISGGQTGADYGGLLAGKELGLRTGGWAPKGFKTENGGNYDLKKFGLKEWVSPEYPPRTEQNVKDSDGTVIFGNVQSRGSQLTLRCCYKHKKPYWIITNSDFNNNFFPKNFIEWLEGNKIGILNVAGNRESVNPGIEQRVKNYLVKALKGLI